MVTQTAIGQPCIYTKPHNFKRNEKIQSTETSLFMYIYIQSL